MNPLESVLYPASYYCHIAFFVAKAMAHIFSTPEIEQSCSSSSQRPKMLRKSDIPLIVGALDGHFSSDWESQLYADILKVFRKSMIDESVPIGAIALLELLSEVHNMGQLLDGERSRLILPPYPHGDYFSYFIAALILSHRLLSTDEVEEDFWERVVTESGIIVAGDLNDVDRLGADLQTLLEVNIKRYPPPRISSTDPAYRFHYSGNFPVLPNDLISKLRYLKVQSNMYSYIRTRMMTRGEAIYKPDPTGKWKKDFALHFPPCYGYMMDKFAFFEETRLKVPCLHGASDKVVHDYLEARKEMNGKFGKVGLGFTV